MAGYARIQKWCFYGGLVGFAVIVVLLLVNSHANFVISFNLEAHKIFGVNNAYGDDPGRGGQDRLPCRRPSASARSGATMLLVPMMMFFLLWPNWGSTLYGEIRGASDFKRVFTGMFSGLWITVLLSVIFLLLIAKTFGSGLLQELQRAVL